MDLLCWPQDSDQGGAAGEFFQDAPTVLIARRDLTQAMSNHLGIGCELCSCRSKPAGLVWQRGPSCFGNRRLLHAPRVWAGAFRPRVCGGPAGATRTFFGDRSFRATSEWLLVGSRHSVVSSRARGRWPGLWRQRLHRHCRECRTSGLCPGRWSCARGSAPLPPQRHKFKNGSELHKTPTIAWASLRVHFYSIQQSVRR